MDLLYTEALFSTCSTTVNKIKTIKQYARKHAIKKVTYYFRYTHLIIGNLIINKFWHRQLLKKLKF